jgi:hypothetical protein
MTEKPKVVNTHSLVVNIIPQNNINNITRDILM